MVAIIGPDGNFQDVSTQQAAQIDAEKAKPAIKSGPIKMIGTDGQSYDVPASSIDAAVQAGWKNAPTPEEDRQAKIDAGVKYGEEHRIETGLKRFGNEALLGIPEYISNRNAGEEQAKIDEEVRNKLSELHPYESGAEKTAGFLSTLLIPGVGEVGEAARGAVLGTKAAVRGAEELAAKTVLKAGEEAVVKGVAEQAVAKTAETTLTRKIAANAAKYATEGAIYSSPQAAVQLAYGDPEQAAETMAWGIGLSGVLGAGAELASSATKAVIGKAGESIYSKLTQKQENGITYLDDVSRNILGITDKQAKRLGPTKLTNFVERADEKGLLKLGEKERTIAVKNLARESGEKISEHLDSLEKHLQDPEIRKLMTSPADIANEALSTAFEKFPEIQMETHKPQLNELEKIVQDISKGGTEPSFEKLQEIRTGLNKGKKAFMKDTPNAELYRFVDGIVQKHLEEGAEKVFAAGKEPKGFADYLQAKFDYHMAKELTINENQFRGTGKIPTNLASLFGHTTGGGAHGGTTGAIVGGALGGHAGAAAAIGINYAMKYLMHDLHGLGIGVSALRKLAKDPASIPIIGGLMAKEGQAAFQAHLDKIPSYLTQLPAKTTALGSYHTIKHFLGNEAHGLSKEQQFKRVTDKITSLATNQDATADQVGHLASTFTGTSVQLASLVAQKKLNAISYLFTQIPKNPNPPKPFQKNDFKPSKQQQLQFEQKLAVVMNPMSIFDKIKNHTVSQGEVETLKAVYPKIYESMNHKILEVAYQPEHAGKVSRGTKMALSKFTGVPLDSSLAHLSNIQKALQTPPPQLQSNPPQQKASSAPKFNHMPSLQTETQRRTYK